MQITIVTYRPSGPTGPALVRAFMPNGQHFGEGGTANDWRRWLADNRPGWPAPVEADRPPGRPDFHPAPIKIIPPAVGKLRAARDHAAAAMLAHDAATHAADVALNAAAAAFEEAGCSDPELDRAIATARATRTAPAVAAALELARDCCDSLAMDLDAVPTPVTEDKPR